MSGGTVARGAAIALIMCVAAALAACGVVGSSAVIDEAGYVGCRSTFGSYSLPKQVLHIIITKKAGGDSKAGDTYILDTAETIAVPDNEHVFCLEHLRSPVASDEVRLFKNKITVEETPKDQTKPAQPETVNGVQIGLKRQITGVNPQSTPFLQLIASKAVDHTAGIVRRILRTAFILISNNGNFQPARSALSAPGAAGDVTVADFQVDPFDYREMARVNRAVHSYGFCFVLEDYTFDRSRAGASAQRYCARPDAVAAASPPPAALAIRELHYLVPKPVNGIFFRPRAAYRLSIFTNGDPDRRGWRLGRSMSLNMENIMPIVSVGVDRAVFATRRTGLVFDDGLLKNVCISKGSELEGGIQIPLDVIYGIIALPSETIIAATTDATTAKQLADARAKLITAQNDYIAFLNRQKQSSDLSGPDKPPGPLTLDTTHAVPPDLDATKEQPPPDAGEIVASGTQAQDALAQICAELLVSNTSTPLVTGTSTPGNF